MRMLDLFSGIGGFALAAKWVWEDELDIVGFCEIEKYAQKVLKKNFPGVPIYEDITKLNGKSFKNIDLLTGGFPCQDISIAGKGAGLEGARSGLWTEMHRIISEVRPRFALIENVPMLTIRGGTRVIADLAEIGYDCEWQIIGADDVGAWHRRKRIWIVAYPTSDGCTSRHKDEKRIIRKSKKGRLFKPSGRSSSSDIPNTRHTESQGWDETSERQQSQRRRDARSKPSSLYHDVPDPNKQRLERHRGECELGESGEEVKVSRESNATNSNSSRSNQKSERRKDGLPDTKSKFITRFNNQNISNKEQRKFRGGSGRKRKPDFWSVEPNVGRVAHGIPNRVDRLKGLGNAIVPQVAALIMERIKNA